MKKTTLLTSIAAGAISVVALMGFATASVLNTELNSQASGYNEYNINITAENCTIENKILTVHSKEQHTAFTFETGLTLNDSKTGFNPVTMSKSNGVRSLKLLKNNETIHQINKITINRIASETGTKIKSDFSAGYAITKDGARVKDKSLNKFQKFSNVNLTFDLVNDLPNFFDLNLNYSGFSGSEKLTIESINISYTCDNEAIHNNIKGITLASTIMNENDFEKASIISAIEDEEGIHINAEVSSAEEYVVFKDGVAITNTFDSSMIIGVADILVAKDGTVSVTAAPANA